MNAEEQKTTRFPPEYYAQYAPAVQQEHQSILQSLNTEKALSTSIELDEGKGRIIVFTLDIFGVFSFICGVLGASRFHVLNGTLFKGKMETGAQSRVNIIVFEGEFPKDDAPTWVEKLYGNLARLGAAMRKSKLQHEKIRDVVQSIVADDLSQQHTPDTPIAQIDLQVDNSDKNLTCISVNSQDTSFFLYLFSHSLYIQKILIERVEISTHETEISDKFWIVDQQRKKIQDESRLQMVQLTALVTKQLTQYLHRSPDPLKALQRFSLIIIDITKDNMQDILGKMLSEPSQQRDLAVLLGTSDFLWEDFIRLHYDHIYPVLQTAAMGNILSPEPEELEGLLEKQLAQGNTFQQKRDIINEFKDYQSYLIDIDHILHRWLDFFFLSHRLTSLADCIIRAVTQLCWKEMTQRYGVPTTAAGIPAKWTVFGLGKLGGSALGYASDIELLFLYSDHGLTTGRNSLSNREFFEQFFRLTTASIRAKREGIFHVDLRMRPHGESGPVAISLAQFINYFGPEGEAHSVERLAFTRLRMITGDREFGKKIIRFRDEFVYHSNLLKISEIRQMRKAQLDQNLHATRPNAKFSPGGLVDLEYNVQILQVIHGKVHPSLRIPSIHRVLRKLEQLGTSDVRETQSIIHAYQFLRRLINALRMLRGNAQDLYLPDYKTPEYLHLAKRMGYVPKEGLEPEQQLKIEFETETAKVRSFIETHLGKEASPDRDAETLVDVLLANKKELTSQTEKILSIFSDKSLALRNYFLLAGKGTRKKLFISLTIISWDILRQSVDPDLALNNWELFTSCTRDPILFFQELLSQPQRLEILLTVLAVSPYLANILIKNPQFLRWLSEPAIIPRYRSESMMSNDLEMLQMTETSDFPTTIGRFRNQELLRIATRDLCLNNPFEITVSEISNLARSILSTTLNYCTAQLPISQQSQTETLVIFAFGKLGGGELNYSSDIDLLAAYDAKSTTTTSICTQVFQKTVKILSDFTQEGSTYRVDLRLRPYGNSGSIVSSFSTLQEYYQQDADLWEIQALLKLSPVAGNVPLGKELCQKLKTIFFTRLKVYRKEEIVAFIDDMREKSFTQYHRKDHIDIKNSPGGIRDIERIVQGLQMIHSTKSPYIFTGHTLTALVILQELNILSPQDARKLQEQYRLLRRIEHILQLYEDKQLHHLPHSENAQQKIARIALHSQISLAKFLNTLEETRSEVCKQYTRLLLQ